MLDTHGCLLPFYPSFFPPHVCYYLLPCLFRNMTFTFILVLQLDSTGCTVWRILSLRIPLVVPVLFWFVQFTIFQCILEAYENHSLSNSAFYYNDRACNYVDYNETSKLIKLKLEEETSILVIVLSTCICNMQMFEYRSFILYLIIIWLMGLFANTFRKTFK